MSPEQLKTLAEQVKTDIDKGIYAHFPALEKKLTSIAEKLNNSSYIVNTDNELTLTEKKILIEQTYLRHEYLSR